MFDYYVFSNCAFYSEVDRKYILKMQAFEKKKKVTKNMDKKILGTCTPWITTVNVSEIFGVQFFGEMPSQ